MVVRKFLFLFPLVCMCIHVCMCVGIRVWMCVCMWRAKVGVWNHCTPYSMSHSRNPTQSSPIRPV